jgi:hypothetical protein
MSMFDLNEMRLTCSDTLQFLLYLCLVLAFLESRALMLHCSSLGVLGRSRLGPCLTTFLHFRQSHVKSRTR